MRTFTPKTAPGGGVFRWSKQGAALAFRCPLEITVVALLLTALVTACDDLQEPIGFLVLVPAFQAAMLWLTRAAFKVDGRAELMVEWKAIGATWVSVTIAAVISTAVILLFVFALNAAMTGSLEGGLELTGDVSGGPFGAAFYFIQSLLLWHVTFGMLYWPLAQVVPAGIALKLAHDGQKINNAVRFYFYMVMFGLLVLILPTPLAVLYPFISYVAFREIFLGIDQNATQTAEQGDLVPAPARF